MNKTVKGPQFLLLREVLLSPGTKRVAVEADVPARLVAVHMYVPASTKERKRGGGKKINT